MSDMALNIADGQITETAAPEATETAAPETAAPETAAKEPKNVLHDCLCASFEVGIFGSTEGGEETIYTTGCTQQTKRQFAQGHDARFVSFLVDGFIDGYSIRQIGSDGQTTTFPSPADAAAMASPALQEKAAKATANRQAKIAAAGERKAEREAKAAERKAEQAQKAAEKAQAKEAAKAEKASTPQAEVVAGSAEGDVAPAPEGQVKIKVGRWEYNATIDAESGEASYLDGKGEQQTIERDGYRLLGE